MDDVAAFDRVARLYELCMPAAARWKLRSGLALAERDVERVVDVAGGSGRGVRALDAPDRIVVDAAPGMVRRATAAGLPAVVGDATRLPLADESVDAALIVDALHHLGDGPTAIAEAARALRPGGVLVVADFDPTTVRGRALAAAERAVGFDSTFVRPERVAAEMDRVGLASSVVADGFGYVVAGVDSDSRS